VILGGGDSSRDDESVAYAGENLDIFDINGYKSGVNVEKL
jgi:hypothetical protein